MLPGRKRLSSPPRLMWLLAVAIPTVIWLTAQNIPVHLTSVEAAGPQAASPPPTNDLLEPSRFIQVPGPNPIITRGGKGTWDEDVIEASDAFKDFGTYYFYYHGVGKDKDHWRGSYRTGVASSHSPLGPFTKLEKIPSSTWARLGAGIHAAWPAR